MITLCYEMSHTNAKQIGDGDSSTGDTRAYKYLNIAKDRFWSAYCAARTWSDVDSQTWTKNLVASQTQYELPDVSVDANWIKKIEGVSISYTWTTYAWTWDIDYTKARKIDPTNLKQDWNWYKEYQSIYDPIFYVSNKSLFIAPEPSTAVATWLKLTWVRKINDWTSSTTEEESIIPEEFHHVIMQGALPYFYRKQGKIAQANAEMQEYERQERESLIELANLDTSPLFAKYPDETDNGKIVIWETWSV